MSVVKISLSLTTFPDGSSVFQVKSKKSSEAIPDIKSIFKAALGPNIEESKQAALLKNLHVIKSVLQKPDYKIENPEEIVQQVIEIVGCLENGESYVKKVWEKGEARLHEGKLIFSEALKSILDNEVFESLMQAMPVEYREEVTDCCFEELPLQIKSLETLLKYCPNMSKEALERIAATREESTLNIVEMWSLFQEVPLAERVSVVTCSLKCFSDDMSKQYKISIIRIMTEVSFQRRENVVRDALACFRR